MNRTKNHYKTIKAAIEYMTLNRKAEMSFEDMANSLDMSVARLQKVFVDWAGISAKQFERYLSLQYSKELLKQNKSMMETSFQAGLSGSGRLHDLFVDIEAMTPGEYKDKGKELRIYYSFFDTRFGICLVASTERGICNVLFCDAEKSGFADLCGRWPKAVLIKKRRPEHIKIEKYFKGISQRSRIKLRLCGTNFQIKVWEALLSIPEGGVASYGDVATRVGNKKLGRAVGAAVGDNPIGYIIPCHRVLKSTGEISGYRWGVERKRAMLGWEAGRKNK